MKSKLSICILGGGVGGFALLRRLLDRGIDATLFERQSATEAKGFGFLLLENGLRALSKLGVENRVALHGSMIRSARIYCADGELLKSETLSASVAITRHGLIDSVLNGLPKQHIRRGFEFDRFEFRDGFASAAIGAHGERVESDAFIGCDGVRSRCREVVAPGHPWRCGRVMEIVSAIKDPELAQRHRGVFSKYMSREGGLAVGLVPSNGMLLWFLQFDTARFAPPPSGETESFLRDRLDEFPEHVSELLQRTDASCSHVWRTVDMDPPSKFHAGNVALLGDAAHPMLPFTSQGANSAIEDAVILGDLLSTCSHASEIPAALAAYSRMRRPAVCSYVQEGRNIESSFVQPVSQGVMLPLVSAYE
jgi:2-polyprenyl-6-methoxyphenol hydroxylase-like FAD-dependent oxidoreductase